MAAKVGTRAAHQGIVAQIAAFGYADVEELCSHAVESAEALLVVVDRVSDPGNLGAILRTCAGAGVDGVLLSAEDTVGLTAHVAKAAAGTLGRVPVAREARPGPRIRQLRECGFEALVLDPRGEVRWTEADLGGKALLVVGGESRGPRPGVRDACSIRVAVPLAPGVESLNVAVSLGVLLFEAVRQRRFPA